MNITISPSSESYFSATLSALAPFPFSSLVCYGLGPLSRSISRHQFHLLLLILKTFNVKGYIYEPAFSESDVKQCLDAGLFIIKENERGLRRVSDKTLFYMPHCPIGLYQNVLVANWRNPENIILFGNSFSTYLDM